MVMIMDEVLQNKIDKLLYTLSKDTRIMEIKTLKDKLLEDKTLLACIEEYKKNPYNKDLKQQLYQNESYKRYQHLENEIYFLTLEMNRILNRLTDNKGCHL